MKARNCATACASSRAPNVPRSPSQARKHDARGRGGDTRRPAGQRGLAGQLAGDADQGEAEADAAHLATGPRADRQARCASKVATRPRSASGKSAGSRRQRSASMVRKAAQRRAVEPRGCLAQLAQRRHRRCRCRAAPRTGRARRPHRLADRPAALPGPPSGRSRPPRRLSARPISPVERNSTRNRAAGLARPDRPARALPCPFASI